MVFQTIKLELNPASFSIGAIQTQEDVGELLVYLGKKLIDADKPEKIYDIVGNIIANITYTLEESNQ